MMQRCNFALALGALFGHLGLAAVEMPYYLAQDIEEEVENDDNKQALLKVRKRIAKGLKATYGVVMVATSGQVDHSVHTIPVWKSYCEKHGYDFFLQEESLAPSVRDHWTKPRLLLELVSKAKWKYIWLVDPNSMPKDLDKGWQYAIKEHMRKQRYSNDQQKDRLIWCPEDCEQDYEDSIGEGSCYGPHVSGCIFWVKPKQLPIVKTWYQKRRTMDHEPRGLKFALKKTRETSNYDTMLWADVGNEMGRADSSFLATYTGDETNGINVRDQIALVLKKQRELGDILNEKGQHDPLAALNAQQEL